MELNALVKLISETLKEFDSTSPRQVNKTFKAGIGPFGEPQLVKELCERLKQKGYACRTARTPDLMFGTEEWAIEFKIVRPYGDNDKVAAHWSINLLYPYEGSTSTIGDAFKLKGLRASLGVLHAERNFTTLAFHSVL